jgi:hypothetical protein
MNEYYRRLVVCNFRRFFHEKSSELVQRVFDFLVEILNRVVGVYAESALL